MAAITHPLVFLGTLCTGGLVPSGAAMLCALLAPPLLRAQNDTARYIQWEPPQQISFGPYQSAGPQIIAVGDTVHLVWTTNNGPHAFHVRSTNAGSSWSSPIVLVETTYVTGGPRAAAAKSYGYIFSTRCPPPCVGQNFRYVVDLRRSTDAGAEWLTRATIADDGNNTWNLSAYSLARNTAVGFINVRQTPLSNRFGWSWDTGVQWNFYNVARGGPFVILVNGIHLVREVGLFNTVEVAHQYSSDFGQTWTPLSERHGNRQNSFLCVRGYKPRDVAQ
jgi:hypothetical protein